MKIKITLVTLATIFSINCLAQTEKGKFYLGINSNLNFTSTSTKSEGSGNTFEGPTTNQFLISPKVGYFIIDNFVAGLDLSLSYSNVEGDFGNDIYNNTFVLSPFVRYYFLENKFKPFINAKVGFGSLSRGGNNNFVIVDPNGNFVSTQNPDTSITSYELGGGLAYFVSKKISIELNLNYINQTFTTENPFDSSDFESKTSGFQTLVGFSVIL